MRIKSGCKINLGLQILNKREDGYHNLKTIFYPLDKPFDTLDIEKTTDKGITVICAEKGIDPKNNTLTKAYTLYDRENPLDFGLNITLTKDVPHGAGLGGGSANAAAVLTYLQQESTKPLPFDKLTALSARIGADVPFFLYNVPCKAEGIGEILTPIQIDLSSYFLLLLMPGIQISTAWAFKTLGEQKKLLTSKKEQANKTRSLLPGVQDIKNDFESVIFKAFTDLAACKETLLANGAVLASMSGTGSSLFGLFETDETGMKALDELTKQRYFKTWKFVCFEKVKP